MVLHIFVHKGGMWYVGIYEWILKNFIHGWKNVNLILHA